MIIDLNSLSISGICLWFIILEILMQKRFCFALWSGLVLLGFAANCYAQSADDYRRHNDNYGFPLRSSVWSFPKNAPKIMFVCWENPAPAYREAMSWVRDAVEQSWGAHSSLKFEGWAKTCTPSSAGIRIKIGDETSRNPGDYEPHTKGLGQTLDSVKDGMVLNFTYRKWDPECPKASGLDLKLCIQSVAVHEFGHALGFAHEHNRHDRPGECMEAAQGTDGNVKDFTPFDPSSVMNYCNRKYNNLGRLSPCDMKSVEKLYCNKTNPFCDPDFSPTRMTCAAN